LSDPVEIAVKAEDLFHGYGRRVPFGSHYSCIGPDGTQFTNSSLRDLRDVLKRRYGSVKIKLDDQRARARGQDPTKSY